MPGVAWAGEFVFDAGMGQFISRHADAIEGTLSCFNRLLFRGYLPFFSGAAMAAFLQAKQVHRWDLKRFVIEQAERLKTHARRMAEAAGRPIAGRAAVRATTFDRMPVADALAAPGLYLLGGLGSRGFCTAPLLGEHLAALILDRRLWHSRSPNFGTATRKVIWMGLVWAALAASRRLSMCSACAFRPSIFAAPPPASWLRSPKTAKPMSASGTPMAS